MTISGKEAELMDAEIRAEARRLRSAQLARAKDEASARGKEPFDLSLLESLCDTSREGKLDAFDVRQARFEEMYYTDFREVMTIAEFAERVQERNRW